jgi:2-polyprenyl-6-methoxyphenol hydroxylase-like FAD-dependent oxidoreductase
MGGALALKKDGHEVTIFEQAARIEEEGAGIQLVNDIHPRDSFVR